VRAAYSTKFQPPSISSASEAIAQQQNVIARLIANGIPPAAIDAAVEIAHGGHIDLLAKLIARELNVEQACCIARRRGRP
jgi:hypothetical protein